MTALVPATNFLPRRLLNPEGRPHMDGRAKPAMTTRVVLYERWYNLLTGRIIGCAQTVLHALGTGFVEKVYERALVHELGKPRLEIKRLVLTQ